MDTPVQSGPGRPADYTKLGSLNLNVFQWCFKRGKWWKVTSRGSRGLIRQTQGSVRQKFARVRDFQKRQQHSEHMNP